MTNLDHNNLAKTHRGSALALFGHQSPRGEHTMNTHRQPLTPDLGHRRTTYTARALLLSATGLLLAGAAQATPDLAVIGMKLETKPLQGPCNVVSITVRNVGTSPSPGAKGAIVTFPQGTPFQNRAVSDIYVAPLRPGESVTMSVSKVDIKVPIGGATIQATVNAPQSFLEQSFANNTNTQNVSVAGPCQTVGTRLPAPGTCDLALTFVAPTGSTVPRNSPTGFDVKVKNLGNGVCPNRAVRLYRYSGPTASGYGSAVGGTSGSIRQIVEMAPGDENVLTWTDNLTGAGTFTYKTQFTSPHNDGNNFNHSPTKTVTAQ